MDKAIKVENLVKVYKNGTEAIKGISFEVERGEIFGFLGPNGAGKTTTIKILCTILKPTGGKALVTGYDVIRFPSKVRERIGIVFQEPALDDKLTGRENLEYHARLYGIGKSKREKRIQEVLSLTEMEGYENKLVKFYSGGMKRKLEIARAIMHTPDILFLDEPTIGLDPVSRRKIWDYIAKINREEKVTVFLTTHYIEEAEALADRVAIIDKGKISVTGSVEELKKKYGRQKIRLAFESEEDKNKFLKISSSYTVILEKERVVEIGAEKAEVELTKILRNLSEKNIKVREASVKYPSLEDVYLSLVEGEKAAPYAPQKIVRRFYEFERDR